MKTAVVKHMSNETKASITSDLDAVLATTARLFAQEGSAREVAILANALASLQHIESDWGIDYYRLFLQIPSWLYSQVIEGLEEKIQNKVEMVTRPYLNESVRIVNIVPQVSADKDWRDKAKSWLSGEGITNQGRVRSDNIPSKRADGLLFRSELEILLYKALKSLGVSFAPLPVFVRGGEQYKRIEPDFVIVKSGVIMVVEVDGDTVHHETPAEAHARTTMLAHEGVHIERVKASECSTQDAANACAKRILQIIEKFKAAR